MVLLYHATVYVFFFSLSSGIDSSLPSFFLSFSHGHVCVRVLSRGVEYLEKSGRYQEANQLLQWLLSQQVYGVRHRGRWWDRMALNWDFHVKDKGKVCKNRPGVLLCACVGDRAHF